MNIFYPAKTLENNKFNFRTDFGNYLIGDDNTWHGGIHIEGKDTRINSIADGRIIAYRFQKNYKEVEKKEGSELNKYQFSNCFIIIQHTFELSKEDNKNATENQEVEENKENVTFYSLYNHLLPIDFLTGVTDSGNEMPSFMGRKVLSTKAAGDCMVGLEAYPVIDTNKRDKENLIFLPHGSEVNLATDTSYPNRIKLDDGYWYTRIVFNEEITGGIIIRDNIYVRKVRIKVVDSKNKKYKVTYNKDKKNPEKVGVRVRKNKSGTQILEIIEKNKKIEVNEELFDENWYKLKDKPGFVHKSEIEEKTILLEPDKSKITLDEVVVCDIPVKGGQLIGSTGLKQKKGKTDYYVCHHEIFMKEGVDRFLNNDFEIYSEVKKPETKKKYYLLPKDTILYKNVKNPDTVTFSKKTPVKILDITKDNYCKVRVLKKVIRPVKKSALKATKANSKKYTIIDFKYVNEEFDHMLSENSTLKHIKNIGNSLVEVEYRSGKKYDSDFWIPFSDLSMNYTYKTVNKPVLTYKSIVNSESCEDIVNEPQNEPTELEFTMATFSRKKPVREEPNYRTTYKKAADKERTEIIPDFFLDNNKYKHYNYRRKKYYPSRAGYFITLNNAFGGNLDPNKDEKLYFVEKCDENGDKNGNDLSYTKLLLKYKGFDDIPIVPNITRENDDLIEAIVPVEVYKPFDPSDQTILPRVPINVSSAPLLRTEATEEVMVLNAFFENKLPISVDYFELKRVRGCNASGKPGSSHRKILFDIKAFNKEHEIQERKREEAVRPKIGDEVSLIKDVTDVWLTRAKDSEATQYKLEKDTIVKLTGLGDLTSGGVINQAEKQYKFHYKQLVTHDLYLGNNAINQKGWVKLDILDKTKYFSPYDWDKFGFVNLDAGNEYIYKIKGTLGLKDNDSDFIKKIWGKFNFKGGAVIEAREVFLALKIAETRYEMSRIVAQHKTEWSYDVATIKTEVTFFYDSQITYAEELKLEQSIIDGMKASKAAYLSNLDTQIADLNFWNKASAPYTGEVDHNLPARNFPSSNENKLFHFHPLAFINHMKLVCGKTYQKGDTGAEKGKILEDFTERTEKTVKQFQKDYMKLEEPTGIVDRATLEAIDEFSEKWIEQISDHKCLCHSSPYIVKEENRCPGYGKGKKNEHPGMHRTLLWSISALKFYLSEQKIYTYCRTSAGYRCWAHNNAVPRRTTNHMGKAVDINYYENGKILKGKKQSNIKPLKAIRDNFYIKYLNAVPGWGGKKNRYRIEPIGTTKDHSYSWIHIDISKYEAKYLKDEFFVKEQKLIKGKSLNEF